MSIDPQGPRISWDLRTGPLGSTDANVLVAGGHYVHCGEPMQPADSCLGRLPATSFTDPGLAEVAAAQQKTRVLRCACGFQMDVPA